MTYRIPSGIYVAQVAADMIILDRRRDRYGVLPRSLASSFQSALTSSADNIDPSDLAQLQTLGLLEVATGQTNEEPVPVQTIASRLDCADVAVGKMLLARVFIHIWQTRWQLRNRGLDRCLTVFERQRITSDKQSDDPAMRAIVSAFDQCAGLVGRTDRCLPISLALATFLCRFNIRARLVIGVQTGPFMAHCWVQLDDVLLVDDPDFVARFQPILVL